MRPLIKRAYWKEISTVGAVAAVVVVLTVAATSLLEVRGAGGEAAELVSYAREEGVTPTELAARAARGSATLFVGGIHGAAQPKRIAADIIEAVARQAGLDAVVLEVPSSMQPYIDRYLRSDPENTEILLSHPRTLRTWAGVPRANLQIYRRIWQLNQELGPARSIRIIAADLPTWPPDASLSLAEAARRYAQRDEYMLERMREAIFRRNPGAQVLVFMGGYHALDHGGAALRVGGGDPIPITWLATRLREQRPGGVYSILMDGVPGTARLGRMPSYTATRAFPVLEENLTPEYAPLALPIDDHFAFLDQPIYEVSGPSLRLELRPRGYELDDVTDGYIFLGPTGAF